MTIESKLRQVQDDPDDTLLEAAGDEAWFVGESAAEAKLAARQDERFEPPVGRRITTRVVFATLLVIALLVHAAIIAAFLYRDAHTPMEMARVEETPVEVIVEKPPEPEKLPKPPEQKPPELPKPKEDLSPAMSAPRAPTEDKVKTEAKEAKTAAPNKVDTPTKGQPKTDQSPPPPKPETTPPEPKKEEAAKEDDKREAEALDKARKAAAKAKQAKTKEAKAAPKRKSVPNALAALAGAPQLDATMSFARPTPKTKIYGGTEDVRWMSMVEAMLEAKVTQLPRTAHWRDGGRVVIYFHVDVSGRVISREIILKSGYPDIDAIAMRALAAAQPFPAPPPGLERGLYWGSTFDGQLPVLHVSKR